MKEDSFAEEFNVKDLFKEVVRIYDESDDENNGRKVDSRRRTRFFLELELHILAITRHILEWYQPLSIDRV